MAQPAIFDRCSRSPSYGHLHRYFTFSVVEYLIGGSVAVGSMASGLRQAARAASVFSFLILTGCGVMHSATHSAGPSNYATADEHLTAIRASHGLTTLKSDPQLEKAALEQARLMAKAGRMTHTTGFGKGFATRMKQNGVRGAAAENVAYGPMDLNKLFSMWMNSSGHRRNMLDPRFTRYGLAYAYAGNGSDWRYWALVVGK
jgi:uncharacterized protein YkwD